MIDRTSTIISTPVSVRCAHVCSVFESFVFVSSMYQNINPYESLLSSPGYLFNGHYLPAKPLSITLESESIEIQSSKTHSSSSIVPPFQRRLPHIFLISLGFVECFSGLMILSLQLLIFDLTLTLWCGTIDALAGAAILVLVMCTDCERHQMSVVWIFQLITLILTIIDFLSHIDLYRRRCLIKANEPTRPFSFQCYVLIIQMTSAALVLLCTILFSIIYFRITLIVLKQAHGTLDLSNAIHLTPC